MQDPRFTYIFLELLFLAVVWVFASHLIHLRAFADRRWFGVVIGTFVLWTVFDQVAIRFRLWAFPAEKNMGMIVAGLPFEEYLLFVIHTLACTLLLQVYHADTRR